MRSQNSSKTIIYQPEKEINPKTRTSYNSIENIVIHEDINICQRIDDVSQRISSPQVKKMVLRQSIKQKNQSSTVGTKQSVSKSKKIKKYKTVRKRSNFNQKKVISKKNLTYREFRNVNRSFKPNKMNVQHLLTKKLFKRNLITFIHNELQSNIINSKRISQNRKKTFLFGIFKLKKFFNSQEKNKKLKITHTKNQINKIKQYIKQFSCQNCMVTLGIFTTVTRNFYPNVFYKITQKLISLNNMKINSQLIKYVRK